MYNNYGENQSNLKFLFVFSMKKNIKGIGHAVALCGRW